MESLLAAELAILHQLNTVRIILLVLCCVVVSLLAFCACEYDLVPHDDLLLKYMITVFYLYSSST